MFSHITTQAGHMINRLMQFVDLKKILTLILIALAGYATVVLNNAAEAHEAGLRAEHILIGNGEPGVLALLKEIKTDIAEVKRIQAQMRSKEFYIFNAEASVANIGATSPSVLINELGIAQIYRTQKQMKVKNVTSPSRESSVFTIIGTYRDADPVHAIRLCTSASTLIGVPEGETAIHVEISPVDPPL